MSKHDPLRVYAEFRERFGIRYTRDHIRRLVKQGKFPAPRKLSPRLNAWPESVILEWITSKAA